MKRVYPFGYILFFLSSTILFADRIDQYYQLRVGMEKYLELLKKNVGDQALSTLHLDDYDNAQNIIKATSDVATGCITSSIMMSANPTPMVKVNAVLQLIMATYALIIHCYEVIHNKKEQKTWLSSLDYIDIVKKFPHMILIEYQIKIMKLLLEMNIDGNQAEIAFARMYLVSMILPGPYEGLTKRLVKKIYKKYFDKNGSLVSLEPFEELKTSQNFFKKVPSTSQELIVKVDKFSPKFHLLYDSMYKNTVFTNAYNLKILELIEAGRTRDIEKMNLLVLENPDTIFASIYNFYSNQN
jgi:hypothetical protein